MKVKKGTCIMYLNEHFHYHNSNIDPNLELYNSKMSYSTLVLNHCALMLRFPIMLRTATRWLATVMAET